MSLQAQRCVEELSSCGVEEEEEEEEEGGHEILVGGSDSNPLGRPRRASALGLFSSLLFTAIPSWPSSSTRWCPAAAQSSQRAYACVPLIPSFF